MAQQFYHLFSEFQRVIFNKKSLVFYTLSTNIGSYYKGYYRSLATFFFQVLVEDEAEFWAGTRWGEIKSVVDLCEIAKEYVIIPGDIRFKLQSERELEPPTEIPFEDKPAEIRNLLETLNDSTCSLV